MLFFKYANLVLPLFFTVKKKDASFHSLPVGEKLDVLLAIIDFFIEKLLSQALSAFHATARL